MPINRLLQSTDFSPAEIRVIVSAYERVLARLQLADRIDPLPNSSPHRSSRAPRTARSNVGGCATARLLPSDS